jgi:hypothetical protein
MGKIVIAQFRVTGKVEQPEYTNEDGNKAYRITMTAVQGTPFGKYTPVGDISMIIKNDRASQLFEVGKEYEVRFSESIPIESLEEDNDGI